MVQAQQSTPFTLKVWAFAVIGFPFVASVYWPASYAFYVLLLLVSIADAVRVGAVLLEPSWPLFGKWAALLVATFFHVRASGQVVNFASLMVADVAIYFTIARYDWNPLNSAPFFRLTLWMMFFGAWIGLGLSAAFSGPFGWSNPFLDLIHGQRVRIYSNWVIGHSMLADFAFVAGLLCLANLGNHHLVTRIFLFMWAIATLVATNTGASWLLIGVLGIVYVAEFVGGPLGRTPIYVVCGAGLVALIINPEIMTNALAFLRYQILHRYAAAYGSDLTAGRKLLNSLFLDALSSHPLVGVGHDAPVMQYGTQVVMGRMQSAPISESPFRFPAEYGALAGFALLFFILKPLQAFKAANRGVRALSIGLVAGLIASMSANSLFDVAQAPQVLLYGSLLLITGAAQFRGLTSVRRPARFGLQLRPV